MDSNYKHSDFPQVDSHGCVVQGTKRLAHLDIPGGAQVVEQGGYLFVGHLNPPEGTTVIDVRDPTHPVIASRIVLPDRESHSHKVMVAGDLMVVNSQRHRRKFFRKSEKLRQVEGRISSARKRPAREDEIARELGVQEGEVAILRAELTRTYSAGGFRVFDISDPTQPRELCHQRTGGMGAHGFDFDGHYAYVSTEMQGFRGNILVIYDLSKPDDPQQISRWWMPGQEADTTDSTAPLGGRWLHHALRDGNMLWAACSAEGVWAIDISDITIPTTAGSYNYHPPSIETTHTVMALPQNYGGRKLALAVDEEHDGHPRGQPHAHLWILDVTEPARITPLSVFEVSELDSPWSRRGGRFGASQIVERPTGDLVFAAWFAGGLRVIDIKDPARPREVAAFIPPPPPGLPAPQSMDLEVDDRGIIYLLDRNRGVDILELL